MKLTIINNYPRGFTTDRIDRLQQIYTEFFPEFELEVMHHESLDKERLEKSSGIVLSGSNQNVSEFPHNPAVEQLFEAELKYIQNHPQQPILGICYGFHLIGFAFQGTIQRMDIESPGNEIIKISPVKSDQLISKPTISVNLFHRDYISPTDPIISRLFRVVATYSRYGYPTIQYMHHLKSPIFAIQFHPETHLPNRIYGGNDIESIHMTRIDGEEVLCNFGEIVKRYSR